MGRSSLPNHARSITHACRKHTNTAGSIVQTAAAVRLLGAETILTGISARVARTLVTVGLDIPTLHTVSRLSEGIELPLSWTGKPIERAGAKP